EVQAKLPFSRSCVLYWMEAVRSNSVERTRRKSQKEQWEIFVALLGTSAVGSHSSHGSRTDSPYLECQRGPLLQGGAGSLQTFQVPLHLASTAQERRATLPQGASSPTG